MGVLRAPPSTDPRRRRLVTAGLAWVCVVQPAATAMAAEPEATPNPAAPASDPAAAPSSTVTTSTSAAPVDEAPAAASTPATSEGDTPPAVDPSAPPGGEDAQPTGEPASPPTPSGEATPTDAPTVDPVVPIEGIANVNVTETEEAAAATDQLEGASLDQAEPLPAGVPERLPRLQLAGWWSIFGGVTLATAGGIFAGLAEREQTEAASLATSFDPVLGSRLVFEDVQTDYERHVQRGNAYAWTSRGFLIVGGAGIITGIVLFALDKKRGATTDTVRVRVGGASRLEVTF